MSPIPAVRFIPLWLTPGLRADYATACCFEKELCVQDRATSAYLAPPPPEKYSDFLICPLRAHPKPFTEIKDLLSLSYEAAKILDDVRFLTLSVTAVSSQTDVQDKMADATKVRSTASFMSNRLKTLPETQAEDSSEETEVDRETEAEDNLVTETIRLAALVYSEAVVTMKPLSRVKKDLAAEKTLTANITAVSATRWKRMPGVFLWIMLVAVAQVTTAATDGNEEIDAVSKEEDSRRKFLRRKMAAAAQTVGQVEFGLSIAYLRAFWLVQRWVAEEAEERTLGKDDRRMD